MAARTFTASSADKVTESISSRANRTAATSSRASVIASGKLAKDSGGTCAEAIEPQELSSRWSPHCARSHATSVSERLHRSTGELTAWELAHPADEAAAVGRAVGI